MSDIYVENEGDFVNLKDEDGNLGGINSINLDTTPEAIILAYNMIIRDYRLTQTDIRQIIKIVEVRTLLMFCYYSKIILDNKGKGIPELISSLQRNVIRTELRDVVLHDIFVAEIGSKYADKYKIEIFASKKAKGFDLLIGDFKCECKIRMGYLNKEAIKKDCEGLLNDLATKEYNKVIKNRVVGAFLKQEADIVFVDSTRTVVGYGLILTNNMKSLPELKKYSLILYSQNRGESEWDSIFIPPDDLDPIKRKYNKAKQALLKSEIL